MDRSDSIVEDIKWAMFGAEENFKHSVKSRNCKNIYGSKYKESEIKDLMNNIENGKCLWLYVGHCNETGRITTMEY